jgi:hypothetical protein
MNGYICIRLYTNTYIAFVDISTYKSTNLNELKDTKMSDTYPNPSLI